ncbi:disintegrin and metalloproteinase domain-containing protein 9-like [Paroedura picta]|uniref:disintegrin and metalloproteinase domain-containing protein 9-like n=1 Tax=Paroedura picta TaxID=143630 RepID=UPI0040569C35
MASCCDKELRKWLCFLWSVIVVECIFPTTCSDSLAPYISYEIIIPRRLEPKVGKSKKEGLSYIIKAAGKEHIIRLIHQNNFLVENLPVFTYDSKGRKRKSHPYVPAGCYYGGYVEDTADSLVALSTCFGLRGFLKIRGLNYGLEPLGGSQTFQHLLYLTNRTGFSSTLCGLKAADLHRKSKKVGGGKASFAFDLLYIEMYIVVDNMMFHFEGRNETRVIHVVLDTINMVYTHYRFLNIAVTLVGLDIWQDQNPIDISRDGKNLIDDFNEWKAIHGQIESDTTHLFAHQRFDVVSWPSIQGSICKSNASVGIDAYLSRDLAEFSITVSHTLGHNLGMTHDEPNCFCDEQTNCIMHDSNIKFAMFSNCSIASLSDLRMGNEINCLFNQPRSQLKHCGNKVVDFGEQCDCGTELQCKEDPCCHPNCTYKAKAVCAHEDCCKDCQLAPKGMSCRPSMGLCDLPEYCTGKSMWCPDDVYKQDGTRCDINAYCYEKRCSTHHLQCIAIFGEEARAAPETCFRALNMAGNEVGNCGGGGDGERFVKCSREDSLCGRLYCSGVKKLLNPSKYVQLSVSGVPCWSTRHQPRKDARDKGAVSDGTACGRGQICLNRTCVPVSLLKSKCDMNKKCHGRGVCNSRHNCHCPFGWAPPYCKDFGAGGSIDSGSPTEAFSTAVLSFALKLVIPIILAVAAAITFLGSRLRSVFSRCRQRGPH